MRNILLVFFVFVNSFSYSQFYSQFNVGYSYPFYAYNLMLTNSVLHMYDYYQKPGERHNVTEGSSMSRQGITRGAYVDLENGYLYKKRLSLSLGIQYHDTKTLNYNPISTQETIYVYTDDSLSRTIIINNKLSSRMISLNPKIGFHFKIWKINYSFALGYILNKTKVYLTSTNRQESLKYNSTTEYELSSKHDYIHTISLSNSVRYTISNRIGLIFEVAIVPFEFRTGTVTQTYFKSIDNYDGTNRVKEDYTDKSVKNLGVSKLTSYHLNFSLGIRYNFVKKEPSK